MLVSFQPVATGSRPSAKALELMLCSFKAQLNLLQRLTSTHIQYLKHGLWKALPKGLGIYELTAAHWHLEGHKPGEQSNPADDSFGTQCLYEVEDFSSFTP